MSEKLQELFEDVLQEIALLSEQKSTLSAQDIADRFGKVLVMQHFHSARYSYVPGADVIVDLIMTKYGPCECDLKRCCSKHH
jgi:hypothetical protein